MTWLSRILFVVLHDVSCDALYCSDGSVFLIQALAIQPRTPAAAASAAEFHAVAAAAAAAASPSRRPRTAPPPTPLSPGAAGRGGGGVGVGGVLLRGHSRRVVAADFSLGHERLLRTQVTCDV
jgi:hypothetical protein